jgi:hypothetical protein
MLNELKWLDAQADWDELHYATDPEACWSFDDIVLFKKGSKYALFFDSGCSCPSPFEDNPGGDVYTKAQLLKVVNNWHGDRTEKVMKDWILENIK